MAISPNTKPYVKLAGGLVVIGGGLLTIERLGLSNLSGSSHAPVHVDPTLLSLMVLAPVGLIIVGCLIFLVGKIRRL